MAAAATPFWITLPNTSSTGFFESNPGVTRASRFALVVPGTPESLPLRNRLQIAFEVNPARWSRGQRRSRLGAKIGVLDDTNVLRLNRAVGGAVGTRIQDRRIHETSVS